MSFCRLLIRELKLDVRGDLDDKQLLQFQSVVFTKVIEHYERVASDPKHRWSWADAGFAAEAFMKGLSAYEMWRRDTGGKNRHWVIEFFRRLAAALISELRR